MTDGKRETLTLPKLQDDPRSDRDLLIETNRAVQQLVLRGAKTLVELEHAIGMLNLHISALGLTSRSEQALISNRILTIRQLLAHSPSSLLEMENIGRLARNEIIEVLANNGLRLAEPSATKIQTAATTVEPRSEIATRQDSAITNRSAETSANTEAPSTTTSTVSSRPLKKGDVVKHPTQAEWGAGRVVSVPTDDVAAVIFRGAGEKKISLKHIQLERLAQEVDAPTMPTVQEQSREPPPGKELCNNCGQPTVFTENAAPQRVALGWCDSCFKHSQRTFKDSVTGESRYFDELRTVDGIKSRYSPK